MTNPINPSVRNSGAGNTSNNPSFFGNLRHRITSLFRSRSESSLAPTSGVTLTSASSLPEELENILHSWIKEAPEETGRKKFYDLTIRFYNTPCRWSFTVRRLGLSSLPNIFEHEIFKEIKYFDVSHNKLLELPKSIVHLKEIEKVEVSFNRLKTLPEGFSEFPNLERLGLRCNCLLELPDFSSEKLKQANVSDNFLTEIPPTLCSLKKSELDARNNLNGYLNDSIPASYHLKKIHMAEHYNEQSIQTIDDLIDDACQNVLKDWVETSPEGENRKEACNRIVSFLVMPNQVHLYLNTLNLSCLPEIFKDSRFNKLQVLNLSNNNLESIPKEIADLKQLKCLDLSNNKLETIPEEIMNSEQIMIDVINNKFTSLPPSFLKKLVDQFTRDIS